ncbi:MAG: CvpA family protein [Bacteroidetes bacterium]|nr:CvpA family protein [Bacteroidota bacterium]
MGIDIALGVILFSTFIIGYKQGLIMSVFAVVSYLLGFFMAMHFSFVIANYIHNNFNIPEQWIPIIAFILLYTSVIFFIRFLGKFVEKLVNTILPTLFNRLVGSALWMFIGFVLFSLIVQLLDRAGIFTDQLKVASVSYVYLIESGQYIVDNLGEAIPFVKNLYQDVNQYFNNLAEHIEI